MLNGITWTEYFITVMVSLMIYYTYVGLRYYAGNLKQLAFSKKESNQDFAYSETHSGPASQEAHLETLEEADELDYIDADYTIIDELIVEIRLAVSSNASDLGQIRQEIAQILKKYHQIKDSPLRPSLNELIVSEVDKMGLAASLDLEEVDQLWDRLV